MLSSSPPPLVGNEDEQMVLGWGVGAVGAEWVRAREKSQKSHCSRVRARESVRNEAGKAGEMEVTPHRSG
jgi:hypothetical protein